MNTSLLYICFSKSPTKAFFIVVLPWGEKKRLFLCKIEIFRHKYKADAQWEL